MATDVLPDPMTTDFVPDDLDAESWEEIEPLFEQLADRELDDEQALIEFLDDWNELTATVSEARNRLRVAKACNTDDDAIGEKWAAHVESVQPKLREWSNRLGEKLVDSPAREQLEETDYQPFIEQTETNVELFTEENIPLEQKLTELATEHGEVTGGWEIEFDGETYTYSGIRRFFMHPDRDVRREAWEATARTRLEDVDTLDEIFDEMLEHRRQVADNAGFDDYRSYVFAEKMRDYDPEACFELHDLIEQEVLPLAEEIVDHKCDQLGLDDYRPWDKSVDPSGQGPLEPFDDADELEEGVTRMMERLDDDLGAQFEAIRPYMDLEARPNKEQGGFSIGYTRSRRPFIFGNATGQHPDVTMLLHESGHAFHTIAMHKNEPMVAAQPPMEFCEVASMAMELLHYDTLDELYEPEDQQRATEQHLRRIPRLLLTVARGDAFQHWLYTTPEADGADRRDKWTEMQERFSPFVDKEGIPEEWISTSWQAVPHFFSNPFYFIEYGFAQLGALQVAVNAEHDAAQALEDYKYALAQGSQRDAAGLYEAAGAQFVPDREKVAELMDWIRGRLF